MRKLIAIAGGCIALASAIALAQVTTNPSVTGVLSSVFNGITASTGTGNTVVLQNTPTLTTPNIGAATGSSLNLGSGALTAGAVTGSTSVGATKSGAVTNIGHAGGAGVTVIPDNATLTFTISNASGLVHIAAGSTGKGAVAHVSYASATITILADPSTIVENSAAPTAGKFGIYKSADSYTISVVNKLGSQQNLVLSVTGTIVTAVTDPA